MKTATPMQNVISGEIYYCLEENGKAQYATWKRGTVKGTIVLYTVDKRGNCSKYNPSMLFGSRAKSPEDALEKLGYQVMVQVACPYTRIAIDIGNSIYQLHYDGNEKYVLAETSSSGPIRLLLTCKDGIQRNGIYYNGDKTTIEEVFYELNFSLTERLETPIEDKKTKESVESDWEQKARQKQDEI